LLVLAVRQQRIAADVRRREFNAFCDQHLGKECPGQAASYNKIID
jgi:hypothetical protein